MDASAFGELEHIITGPQYIRANHPIAKATSPVFRCTSTPKARVADLRNL
jgi:hypothetical protein